MGFDCSGLIWWAYRQHGGSVPRITTDQAKTGHAVPKARPRPGDIVVFRTGNSPRGLHTGISTGDGSFIHSPRKGERAWKAWMSPTGRASSLLCAASCIKEGSTTVWAWVPAHLSTPLPAFAPFRIALFLHPRFTTS